MELLVPERVPELATALHEKQLVDGVDDDPRGDFDKGFLQVGVGGGAEIGIALPERRDLTLLQLGFRQDVAVYLDENLLDDIRLRGQTGHSDKDKREGDDTAFHGVNTVN